MFTGIIEDLGLVTALEQERENLHITLKSKLTPELKIDQSVAHNGVCLTVVAIHDDQYTVTAIRETLLKTNLSRLNIGDFINLERGMKLGDRLDGHIVQGHVDLVGKCTSITEQQGSWLIHFEYGSSSKYTTIEKGSVTINGVSLTVVDSGTNSFSVAIIPYTFENTTFQHLKADEFVNLEFDVLGKYIQKLYESRV
ncbi:riboflavin synthase alpha chain [Flavobacteriaceae bacterium MAR_2010_72]|nr:riboflavin synthase alpha chain [Flavobacteriaceae bacterium MAR_2010_72]TVZ58359.1 riboflavin synthase alpha chain [Flavobacteriaceae bacterium MAR_2010_105]